MDPSALRESHPAKAPRSRGSTTHMSANRKKTDMSWRILLPTLTETKRKSLLQGNQSVAHDHARARRPHYKVSDRLYENSPEAESHNRPKTQVLSHPHDDFPRLAANHLLYQDAIQPRL